MHSHRKLMVLALVLVMALSLVIGASGAAAPAGERVDVLIGFHGQPNPGLVRAFGGQIVYEFGLIPTIHAWLPAAAVDALARHPLVRYLEPNGEVWATQETPWGITKVGAPTVWSNPGVTGSGVSVAILDTGIYKDHPDLKDRVIGGVTTVDKTSPYSDKNGHGTHVAGTVAAVNNTIGVVGVAPQANLYAVKVLSDRGSGTWGSVGAGIDWVVARGGIQVINMSLSGGSFSQTLMDSCDAAYNAGVLLVAAAGNNGPGTDTVGYPAKYASVVAVSASDQSNKLASFSSTGFAVELIAPGVGVRSTVPNTGYATYSGTSMASPHVAGVAALVFASDSTLTAPDVRAQLRSTAQTLGLHEDHQGYGLVRADRAVPPTSSTTYEVKVSASPTTGGTVSGGGLYPENAQVTVTATPNTGHSFVSWSENGKSIGDAGATYIFTVEGHISLVANFALNQYTVTFAAGVNGTVSDAGGTYDYGAEVSVTAVPHEDYIFDKWTREQSGDTYSTSANLALTVTENLDLLAHFKVKPDEPIAGSVRVGSINYGTSGGRNNDRHLNVTIGLIDGQNQAVSGATVSADLQRQNVNGTWSTVASYSGTTGSGGSVTFSYNNAPAGTYQTVVTNVSASGLTWDEATPVNNHTKK